ncbi:hypothetical protein C1646_662991 [Rhizophagus diaphanus]|nr:hypothetical protein C1646_662991 [Rhizophagus diaphanus] [Rhizophagus sp. MUCL 43196]
MATGMRCDNVTIRLIGILYNLRIIAINVSGLRCFSLIYEVESFTPAARAVHSSIFIESNNRLYFLGGEINGNIPVNEVFYLDVSKNFDTVSPPWTDLTPAAAIPFRSSWAGVSDISINSDSIISLFGGYMLDNKIDQDSFTSNLYTFNVTSQQWSIPQIQGNSPTRRRNMKSVIDDSGIIYIFGGYFIVPTTPQEFMFNDMIKININTFTLSFGSTQNGPTRRCAYTATLLPKGIIVYIGGYEEDGNSIVNINENANNINSIESRYLHSAVLAPDGKIIIYGGLKDALGEETMKVVPDLAVLDTNTFPFEWNVPQVTSNVGIIPSLACHSADIVGDNMIVAFGNITRSNAPSVELNPKIYLLNVMNYTWVNTFDPKQQSTDNLIDTTQQDKITKIKTEIGIICGVIGSVVIIVIIFFINKWKKRDKVTLRIPGEETLRIPSEKRL